MTVEVYLAFQGNLLVSANGALFARRDSFPAVQDSEARGSFDPSLQRLTYIADTVVIDGLITSRVSVRRAFFCSSSIRFRSHVSLSFAQTVQLHCRQFDVSDGQTLVWLAWSRRYGD